MSERVLVIGGGVIGVCAAYYLARDGCAVTLVERGPQVAWGSSYGNSGLIVPSHSVPLAAPGVWWQGLRWMADPESPFYIRPRLDPALLRWLWRFRAHCTEAHVRRALPVLRDLSYRSRALYRELTALTGPDCAFREDGALTVFRTEAGFARGRHELGVLTRAGVTARTVDAREARELEPRLATTVVGALHWPDDASLVPDRFVTGLARAAEALGVAVRRGTEVLGFRVEGRRLTTVETTRGDLPADQVVLAAGAWTTPLGRLLGLRIPIQAAKGYSLTYRRPADGPRLPLLLGEARVAVTPMGPWLRFGGTLELAGLDLEVNRRRVAAVARAPRQYLEGLDGLELVEIWRGLRPVTPDGLPLLGRPRRYENVIVAAGHATIGMSLGPVTGRVVADLVQAKPPGVDLTLLDPDRFGA